MASIRKRGENSYLLVVSRGYDYQGNRLKPAQKTVHPPKGLTAKQTEKWLNEQAVLYEREVKHTPGESVDRSITLAKYIDVWLEQVAPKKLAASTLVRDKQDIRRILPALGHYKLAELNAASRSCERTKDLCGGTGGISVERTLQTASCLAKRKCVGEKTAWWRGTGGRGLSVPAARRGIRWCRGHSHSGSKGFCGRAICRTI